MSFYLKPPRGEVNLHDLVECVQQRIQCYTNLGNESDIKDVNKFDYLFEDCILDRTSHFIFRLGVLIGYVPRKLFMDNELQILNMRLDNYDKNDMELFLKKIVRQLKDCIRLNIERHLSDFYWTLYNVTTKIIEKEYFSHIFEKHSKQDENFLCSNGTTFNDIRQKAFRNTILSIARINYRTHIYPDFSKSSDGEKEDSEENKSKIAIPFWYCNDQVASRTVDLKNGSALFDCSNWRKIISTLFTSYLKIVLNEMKYSNNVSKSLGDDRISGCLRLLKNQYSKNDTQIDSKISLKNLEEESIYFPLCMKNLFHTLKKNHRLSHNERFDLSLFLKGVGLSLNDSLKFWQGEYSQQHSSCSKCSHTWQKSETKYVYSVRHLYGLEGSRKNYRVRSCDHFQSSGLGINSEGGCPFVHYDDENLRSALKKNLPGMDDDVEIIIFERKENATVACKLYGECILKKLKYNLSLENKGVENPLQFFNLLRGKKYDLA